MGWLSRLNPFRKNPTTEERLAEIEKEIRYYEELRVSNLETEKRIISLLLLYSVVIYLVLAVLAFLYYTPTSSWIRMFMYILSLVVFPVLIYFTKVALHKIFVWRVQSKETKLKVLHSEKRKQLDLVKETVPYSKAKEILDKYDPLHFHRAGFEHPISKPAPSPLSRSNQQPLECEVVDVTSKSAHVSPQLPIRHSIQPIMKSHADRFPNNGRSPIGDSSIPQGNIKHPPQTVNDKQPLYLPSRPSPMLSRPILPGKRSTLDKFVDYLVGDGPEHRYALICRRCAGHNGMAMKEEFDYLTFRCCYCGLIHPARKVRPPAPRLETATSSVAGDTDTQEDDHSDDVSKADDNKEISTEPSVNGDEASPEPKPAQDESLATPSTDSSTMEIRQRVVTDEQMN